MKKEKGMNILYIITRSDWGGAQAHLYDLIHYICTHTNHTCSLIVGEEGELSERVQQLDIPVEVLPTIVHPIHPIKDMIAIWNVVKVLKRIKPDIIHIHSSKAGIIGRIAAYIVGIPAIFTAHGWAFTDGVSVIRRMIVLPLEKWLARYTKKIICVSEYDRNIALANGVGTEEQLLTIHNGIPDIESSFCLNTHNERRKDELHCVMVARFSAQKDYKTVVKAIQQVSPEIPVQVSFVGQGVLLEEIKQFVRETGTSEKIQFLGARADVPDILSCTDIFLLVTNYEGFPISILEAMRAGLPVIATDVGGVKEAVVDGVTGYLVPRGESKAVKRKIEILARNPNLRYKMGEAARERFIKYFTQEKMLEKVSGVYHDVYRGL